MIKTRFVLATFFLLCAANFSMASSIFNGSYNCDYFEGLPCLLTNGLITSAFNLYIPVPENGFISVLMPEPAHDAGYDFYISGISIPPYNFTYPNAGGTFDYYVGSTLAASGILGAGGYESDGEYYASYYYNSPVIFDYLNGAVFAKSCNGTCGDSYLSFSLVGGGQFGPLAEQISLALPAPATTPEPGSWLYALAGVFVILIFLRRS